MSKFWFLFFLSAFSFSSNGGETRDSGGGKYKTTEDGAYDGHSGDFISDYGQGSSIKINWGFLDPRAEGKQKYSQNPDVQGSEKAIQRAIDFYHRNKDGIGCNGSEKDKKFEKKFIIVNDFTKPLSQKRQFIINMETGEITSTYVTHGFGSNRGNCPPEHVIDCGSAGKKCAIPVSFNNGEECGEATTLSGFFRVGETYHSNQEGFSDGPPPLAPDEDNGVRLYGIEQGKNHTAADCGKVWHAASYADYSKSQCSNSAGCPAVPPEIFKKYRDAIKDGAMMYNHTILEEKEEKTGGPKC